MADIVVLRARAHRTHRHIVERPLTQRGEVSVNRLGCHGKFLSLKELHRPPLPSDNNDERTPLTVIVALHATAPAGPNLNEAALPRRKYHCRVAASCLGPSVQMRLAERRRVATDGCKTRARKLI